MMRRQTWSVAALYAAAAIVFTWPLARVIDRQIASDLADPLYVCWIFLWTGGQLLRFLSGDVSALSQYWNGNIFHPEPLTVAYAEHMTPQMLQALPIIAATDNVVLAYNLVFLATFVLCGVSTFLLVRDITGNTMAAVVAGFALAFAPYRISQQAHLQVMSVQWLPLVLLGYRRFLATRRWAPLIWGSAAFVVQNLSCGYYLLFFSPFVGLFVVFEMAARHQIRNWRLWTTWMLTAVAVGVATVPFLIPYLQVRDRTAMGVRNPWEIQHFSADTHALVTPASFSWFWAERMPGRPGPEGEGFPGLTIVLLAGVGAVGWLTRRRRPANAATPLPPWRQMVVGALVVLWAVHLYGAISLLVTGGVPVPLDDTWAIQRSSRGLFQRLWVLTFLLVVSWPAATAFAGRVLRSTTGYFVVATTAAALLSFGPTIFAAGNPIANGPYAWFVDHVPGFDGVRVPARFLMFVAFGLAVLSGLGVARFMAWRPRAGIVAAIVCALCICLEAWSGPQRLSVPFDSGEYLQTPLTVHYGRHLPAAYKVVRDDPNPTVLVEFPFGQTAWDVRSVYYAGYHRRPLVNGYSGFFPESMHARARAFAALTADPRAAWDALLESGATYALVHENAYPPERRNEVAAWLRQQGATELFAEGPDRLFKVR